MPIYIMLKKDKNGSSLEITTLKINFKILVLPISPQKAAFIHISPQ